MNWASRLKFARSESPTVRRLRDRMGPWWSPPTVIDLEWDLQLLDSMIRGLPIGIITVWRVLHGDDVIEVVIDGARRLQAIRRHVFAEVHAGLVIDIADRAVVISDPAPLMVSTSSLGSPMELWQARESLGIKEGNLLESVSISVMDYPVMVQTVIGSLADVQDIALRSGCGVPRLDWLADVNESRAWTGSRT